MKNNIFFHFSLPDDENSYVHGILTTDNLFDGTITTKLEQYYIEPAKKYENVLQPLHPNMHTIIYKLSDVKMKQYYHPPHIFDDSINIYEYQHNHDHDASDKLINKFRRKNSKLKLRGKYEKKSDENKLNVNSDKVLSSINNLNKRRKRWLSYDEVNINKFNYLSHLFC